MNDVKIDLDESSGEKVYTEKSINYQSISHKVDKKSQKPTHKHANNNYNAKKNSSRHKKAANGVEFEPTQNIGDEFGLHGHEKRHNFIVKVLIQAREISDNPVNFLRNLYDIICNSSKAPLA
jgi:hypothetical protein